MELEEYEIPRCEAENLAQERSAWEKPNFPQNVCTCGRKPFLTMMNYDIPKVHGMLSNVEPCKTSRKCKIGTTWLPCEMGMLDT